MTNRITGFTSMFWQAAIMALQYLGGRKLRTTLTSLAIVFGVALIFAFNLVLPSAVNAFGRTMTAASGAADLSVSSVVGEAFLPDQPLQTMARVKHIKAVTGLLRRQIALPAAASQGEGSLGEATQFELVGVDPATVQSVRSFVVSEGRFLEPGDTGKAVIPAGIAEMVPQLKVGATFPLITAEGQKSFTIVGWLAEKGNVNSPQIIIPLSDAQAALSQPGLINGIEAAIDAGANRDAVSTDVQKALGDGYRLNSTGQTDVFAAAQVGYMMFDVMGGIALFLGAFLIFNTFRTVIVERRHDLSMLRAIGATRRHLTQMILIESLIQGVLGTVGGLILGYLLALVMTRLMERLISQFMAASSLHITLSASAFALPVFLGLLTTVLAGYWPARVAGRISPLEGLRPSLASDVRRAAQWMLISGIAIMALATLLLVAGNSTRPIGAVVFLVGMVLAAPGLVVPVARLFSPMLTLWFAREGDLARGNLSRQPGRAAITASTLMIGLATLILIAAMVTSFDRFVQGLVNRSFSSDLLLMPQVVATYGSVVGADESLGKRLEGLPDVDTVAGLRYAASSYYGQALEVLGINPQSYAKVTPFDFVKGQPAESYAALATGRTAIINSLGAAMLGLDVGDEFTMQTAEGPQTYRLVGVANDLLHFKLTAVFISQSNLKADFHKAEDVLFMINLKPGADKAAALEEVKRITADYPQFTARITGEYRDVMRETITGAFGLFYGLAALILIPAALGLLNTLTINVLERTREIGVVRATGGTRGQVKRMVLAESLLLGLFGAATGVLAGVAMSYGFIAAFSSFGWDFPYEFPVVGILAAVVVGVLLALFASVLPARNAAKLDIIRALQYE